MPRDRDATTLDAMLIELRAIRALLECGRGARDDADRDLLRTVREAIGPRTFTSIDLVAYAATDPPLAAALLACDLATAHDVGIWCRRMVGVLMHGLRLTRAGASRSGALWGVEIVEGSSE
jgi:hypothetical protein